MWISASVEVAHYSYRCCGDLHRYICLLVSAFFVLQITSSDSSACSHSGPSVVSIDSTSYRSGHNRVDVKDGLAFLIFGNRHRLLSF